MRYATARDAADPDLSVYMNWHHVYVPLRMSTVALPLTMYRPRPLQRCSTTLLFLLTSLTWGLLCVWLGAWHRELDPPRLVPPFRIGTTLVMSCPSRTGDPDISEAPCSTSDTTQHAVRVQPPVVCVCLCFSVSWILGDLEWGIQMNCCCTQW